MPPPSALLGAIDGTVRPIAMPMIDQETSYNGHKQVHALKWQFITTPDGLLFVDGPFDGRNHDSHLVSKSMLVEWAVEHAKGEDGEQRYLYGDQAYGILPAIILPFRRNLVDREHKVFNYLMSKY